MPLLSVLISGEILEATELLLQCQQGVDTGQECGKAAQLKRAAGGTGAVFREASGIKDNLDGFCVRNLLTQESSYYIIEIIGGSESAFLNRYPEKAQGSCVWPDQQLCQGEPGGEYTGGSI